MRQGANKPGWQLRKFFRQIKSDGWQLAVNNAVRYIGQFKTHVPHDVWHYYTKDVHSVLEEEWDNLIILDSARFDIFEECNFIQGNLEKKQSAGTWSRPFLRRNFGGQNLQETVYIGANPYMKQVDFSGFHGVHLIYGDEGFDSHAVHPKKLFTEVIDLLPHYSDKRIIIHFMQPHTPHFSQIAESLEVGVFEAFTKGLVSKEELKISYKQNLNLVMYYAASLLLYLDGTTVITADHGENLGEKFGGTAKLGHANYNEFCWSVPWLRVQNKTRLKKIRKSNEKIREQSGDLDSQLKMLGYK
jgi:hypothetical protein